jgi:hypothetical protein
MGDLVRVSFAGPPGADWGLRQIAFPAEVSEPATLSVGVLFARKTVWALFELRGGNTTFTLPAFVPAHTVTIRLLAGPEAAVRKYLPAVEFHGRLLWRRHRLESQFDEVEATTDGLLV